MLRRRFALAVLALLALAAAGPVRAGPIADFETAMGAAYADYRAALFQTNRKDRAATDAALAGFNTKWAALATRFGTNPPPHLSEDAGWSATLATVKRILDKALAEAATGDLAKAHETLEAIRDEIGKLRARNGQQTFSDRMNAYHARMEVLIERVEHEADKLDLGLLREEAAVLAYLVADIAANVPNGLGDLTALREALAAVTASVEALRAAVRAGDGAAAKAATKALKPPYSRLFLRFG